MACKKNADCESGLEALKVLYKDVDRPIPYDGIHDAGRLNDVFKDALAKSGLAGTDLRSAELARMTLVLMARYHFWHRVPAIIDAVESRLNRMNGTIIANLDAAEEPEQSFVDAVRERVTAMTKAKKTNIKVKLMPALIGGYRLTVNGRMLDYSVRSRLHQMQSTVV
jgi:F0F1-type ATP synthase delta subunit